MTVGGGRVPVIRPTRPVLQRIWTAAQKSFPSGKGRREGRKGASPPIRYFCIAANHWNIYWYVFVVMLLRGGRHWLSKTTRTTHARVKVTPRSLLPRVGGWVGLRTRTRVKVTRRSRSRCCALTAVQWHSKICTRAIRVHCTTQCRVSDHAMSRQCQQQNLWTDTEQTSTFCGRLQQPANGRVVDSYADDPTEVSCETTHVLAGTNTDDDGACANYSGEEDTRCAAGHRNTLVIAYRPSHRRNRPSVDVLLNRVNTQPMKILQDVLLGWWRLRRLPVTATAATVAGHRAQSAVCCPTTSARHLSSTYRTTSAGDIVNWLARRSHRQPARLAARHYTILPS